MRVGFGGFGSPRDAAGGDPPARPVGRAVGSVVVGRSGALFAPDAGMCTAVEFGGRDSAESDLSGVLPFTGPAAGGGSVWSGGPSDFAIHQRPKPAIAIMHSVAR